MHELQTELSMFDAGWLLILGQGKYATKHCIRNTLHPEQKKWPSKHVNITSRTQINMQYF